MHAHSSIAAARLEAFLVRDSGSTGLMLIHLLCVSVCLSFVWSLLCTVCNACACTCIRIPPGLIRVAADELTYPLHIILRFELERALFKGEVEVKDLPAEWNRRMKDMLGESGTRMSFGLES